MLHFMQNIFHPVEIRRACGVTGQEGEAMLQDSIIYVDRYICFESLRADTPEAYAECAHWQNPYFNNANTILVFMHGRWSATIEGSRYTFVPGELCLLKRLEGLYLQPIEFPCAFQRISFSPHYFHVIDPQELLCHVFDFRDFGVGNRITSVQYDSSRLQTNLRAIIAESEVERRRISLVITLAELLNDLMRLDLSTTIDTRPEEVRHIITFLNEHFGEDVDTNQLARQVYVSRTKLARLVKEYTGCTIWDYILNKRILRSVQLLHSGMPNQEAARAVGFKNYSTFYKAFQRILGITPTVERPTATEDPLLTHFYDADAAKRWLREIYGDD